VARPAYGGQPTTESCAQIDVRLWHRDGRLDPGTVFVARWTCEGEPISSIGVEAEVGYFILSYRYSSVEAGQRFIQQHVPLTWTACQFGGRRPWFVCRSCRRRAAILYAVSERFACRRCCGLVYTSQQQSPIDRAVTQAQKIRVQLGGSVDLGADFPAKPLGMHWSKYWRLRDRARVGEEAAEAYVAQLIDRCHRGN
jgi:hypothetical protein